MLRFATTSTFYNEASKVGYNICPGFYKYKITSGLERVYEVEEHMGDTFIEGLGKLHYEHLLLVEH